MTECPARLVTQDVAFMASAWAHYKAGFLPVAGGVQDQSATYVLSMQVLTMCHAMHEKQELETRRG